MGRKLAVLTAFLMFFGVLFLRQTSPAFAAGTTATDLRVFVRMIPESPNSADGTFWEGPGVKVKLELQEKDEKGNWGVRGIKGDKGDFKIYYVWDDLNRIDRAEYREPFSPLTGEHWLFAYAQSDDEKYVSAITKFFIRYNIWEEPVVIQGEEVSVGGEEVRWGMETGGIEGKEGIGGYGEITPEAASTVKQLPTPTAAKAVDTAINTIRNLISGRTNLWILLLILGLALLGATKFLFREKK